MSIREENLLQPLKASDTNPDLWPSFNLKQITITSPKTSRNVSLLSAHHNNPVKVSGALDSIDDDMIHLVQDKRYKDRVLELNEVTTYAFAEYDDGTCGFWAAGRSGWFELQSSAASFKTTYTKMNEAASLFYMLADRLRRAHKRAPSLNNKELRKYAQKVFLHYFEQRKDPVYPADIDEAKAAFHEHRDFLITSMLEGQDGLNWIQTPMLNYFKMKFPDDYTRIEERLLRPIVAAQPRPEEPIQSGRDTSRKRKSQSSGEDQGINKKQKRKAAQQAETRIQLLPKGLLPRTPPASQAPETSSSNEEDGDNIDIVGRKHKSILQPSGGKYSKKAAARQQGLQQVNDDDDNDEESHDGRAQSEESPIATIRNARDLEIATNHPTNHSSPEATPKPQFRPRKYLELKVIEYDLPSTEPQGPGDLWTCTFEGCFYRVYEASDAQGKLRIKEHLKTHASQAQEKIDLVLDESRPYLPVNNLVRRLQAFAPAAGIDSLAGKLSAPIRRQY